MIKTDTYRATVDWKLAEGNRSRNRNTRHYVHKNDMLTGLGLSQTAPSRPHAQPVRISVCVLPQCTHRGLGQITIELNHSVNFQWLIKRVSTHGTKFIWKADRCSSSQEIHHILWSPKDNFYIHKSCHWNLLQVIWIQSTFYNPILWRFILMLSTSTKTRSPKPSDFRNSFLYVCFICDIRYTFSVCLIILSALYLP
jgi:hypothetical protein